MSFWVIQAIGLLGSGIIIASMQFNNRRLILLAQAIACVLWSVHYGWLGAMTAVATNFIGLFRSLVFYFNDKPWAKSRVWLYGFIAVLLVNSVVTWSGLKSLLPTAAMVLTSFALWTRDTKKTRLLFLLNSPMWLFYNLLAGSYSCAVTEAFALFSYIAAVWRFDIRGKKGASHAQNGS